MRMYPCVCTYYVCMCFYCLFFFTGQDSSLLSKKGVPQYFGSLVLSTKFNIIKNFKKIIIVIILSVVLAHLPLYNTYMIRTKFLIVTCVILVSLNVYRYRYNNTELLLSPLCLSLILFSLISFSTSPFSSPFLFLFLPFLFFLFFPFLSFPFPLSLVFLSPPSLSSPEGNITGIYKWVGDCLVYSRPPLSLSVDTPIKFLQVSHVVDST